MENKYTVLKKFGDFKKGDVFDPKDGFDGTEDDIADLIESGKLELFDESAKTDSKNSSKDVSKVTVTFRNPDVAGKVSERVFTPSEHGEDFEKIADEFHKSNDNVFISKKAE